MKVISAKNMSKLEGLAYARGCQELEFMESAGSAIADHAQQFIEQRRLSHVVTLLAGKGNNGGDAYVAGCKLLQKGFRVIALHLYSIDQCGPLCRHQKERFEALGGEIRFVHESKQMIFEKEGIILDGLVGTGFKGAAKDVLADMIAAANNACLPILSIDIPSGLCGNTGKVESIAIRATQTIYLELPKLGFFLEEGWNHVGDLVKATFGLPLDLIEEVIPDAFLVDQEDQFFDLLSFPSMKRNRNKYDAGYVLVVAGSRSMVGAGILSSYSALKSGAGLVRWFYPEEIESLVAMAPLEVIKQPLENSELFFQEMKRAKSLIIGPGMGRDKIERKKIKNLLSHCKIPSVIDADALFFLSKNPSFAVPSNAVLTPHTGEMKRLLEAHALSDRPLLEAGTALAQKKKATILLKGAPNFLFSPNETPHILPFGNPGMATAGTGDVLAGVIGALLSQGFTPFKAAMMGCYLHGTAGDFAAKEKTVFCLTAQDILESLPKAFALL